VGDGDGGGALHDTPYSHAATGVMRVSVLAADPHLQAAPSCLPTLDIAQLQQSGRRQLRGSRIRRILDPDAENTG
jgi:hypothetical protein